MRKIDQLKQLQEEMESDKKIIKKLCEKWNWTVNFNETTVKHTITSNPATTAVVDAGLVVANEVLKQRDEIKDMKHEIKEILNRKEPSEAVKEIRKIREERERQMKEKAEEEARKYEEKMNKRREERERLEAILYMKDAEETVRKLKEEMNTHKGSSAFWWIEKQYMILIKADEEKINKYKRKYPELFLATDEVEKIKKYPEFYFTEEELKNRIEYLWKNAYSREE
jgi:phage protein D